MPGPNVEVFKSHRHEDRVWAPYNTDQDRLRLATAKNKSAPNEDRPCSKVPFDKFTIDYRVNMLARIGKGLESKVINLLHTQGLFYFTEREPRSLKEANTWQENRERTFRGSLQHVLRSLIANNYATQGYTIRLDDRQNAPYSEEPAYLTSIEGLSFIVETERDYLYRISFPDYLYIEYQEEPSWIEMNRDEAQVHTSGYVYSHASIHGALTVYGALLKRRIADLLPRDY